LKEKKEKKRMSGQNALELAGQIGYELYGDIGKIAFEELELCYAAKLSPKFDSSFRIRSYVNLNFYWARGYFKNSIMDVFEECLPSDFADRKVTSATLETMFGSINKAGTKIIPPIFLGYEMCFMPELMTFLGDEMKKKVANFNEALEGAKTTRDALKFGDVEQSLIDEYKNGKNDLFFDGRTLYYYPKTSFVVGTHPLDNQTYTYLEQSGFLSRFHTIQFSIDYSTAREIFTGALAPPSVDIEKLKGDLKNINDSLFLKRNELSRKLPDYQSLLLGVLQEAYEVGERLCKNSELFVPGTLNPRIMGDIVREVNAYKILNQGASNEEVQKWASGRLNHFFDFVADPIIAPSMTAAKQTPREACLKAILELTRAKPMQTKEICEALKQDYTSTTINRALELMRARGLNKGKRYGFYES
jgi:hypothetical protein